ncbi:hypothetical protein ZWY2020_016949, partial [Hordeum vulgare]
GASTWEVHAGNRDRLIAALSAHLAAAGRTHRGGIEGYFAYLFGVREPGFYGAVDSASGQSILFAPRVAPNEAIWTGPAKELAYFKDTYRVDFVFHVEEIARVLRRQFREHGHGEPLLFLLHGKNTDSGNYSKPAGFQGMDEFDTDLSTLHPVLTECRVIKSDMELALIQHANDIKPGMVEQDLESIFCRHASMHRGCRRCAYTCICATGKNSAILHYGHAAAPNDATLVDGDMALMDMGAEYNFYASDITCSYPINGKFTR